MKILDFAIKMEQDGYAFYQQSAQNLHDPAARRMLLSLAQDEKRHEKIIENYRAGKIMMINAQNLADVKNVFEQLAREKRGFINENDNLADVLRMGIQAEQKSVALYRDLAQQAPSDQARQLWEKLQTEETHHEKLLSMTLEYLDNPNIVLETAEFLFYDHDMAP